jgi:hypothetical protein
MGHYEVMATNSEWGSYRSYPFSPYTNARETSYDWMIFGDKFFQPDPTGCTWTFKVWAFRSIDKAGPEASTTIFVPGPMAAAAALNTDGSLGEDVKLTWKAPQDRTTSQEGATTPVQGYSVFRQTSKDMNQVRVANVTGLSYTDHNVTDGTIYYYNVYPMDQYGYGKASYAYISFEGASSTDNTGSSSSGVLGFSSSDLFILAGVVIAGVVVALVAVLMMRRR